MSLDSKEYRLGWNEHSNNFTASFKDLLEQKELVDVTLVADGHSFLAHRLVLSALSPYFRHIFTQVPANQQAFGEYLLFYPSPYLEIDYFQLFQFYSIQLVFMKDISHQTMEGLLAFIYTGEVIVHQESLAEFLKIAKSLNIKGLIDPICSASFTQDEPIESLWPESKYNNQKLQYQSTQTSQRKRSNQQSVNQMILDSTAESSQTSPDHQFNPNYSVDAAANDFSLGSFDYEKNASPNISDDYYERIGAKYSMKGKSTDANDREYFVDKKVVKIKPSIAKRSRKIGNVNNDFRVAFFFSLIFPFHQISMNSISQLISKQTGLAMNVSFMMVTRIDATKREYLCSVGHVSKNQCIGAALQSAPPTLMASR